SQGVAGGLLEQTDVARKVRPRLFRANGVAAVFHDDDLLVVALHVRQRFGQDAGLLLRVGLGRLAHCFGLIGGAVLADWAGSRQCVTPFFPRAGGRWLRAIRGSRSPRARMSEAPSGRRPGAWPERLRPAPCDRADRKASRHRIWSKQSDD